MTFEELISGLGSKIGVELTSDDGSCVINVDDMVVTLMSLPDSDRLAVYGEIGDPPPEGLEQLLSAMLEANHLFAGTAGATISRDHETGARRTRGVIREHSRDMAQGDCLLPPRREVGCGVRRRGPAAWRQRLLPGVGRAHAAQAQEGDFTIVTSDRLIPQYPVQSVW